MARQVREIVEENALTVVQLIYRRKAYESTSKDYEFSRPTMLEHWASGVAGRSLQPGPAGRDPERPHRAGETRVFDVQRPIEEETAS